MTDRPDDIQPPDPNRRADRPGMSYAGMAGTAGAVIFCVLVVVIVLYGLNQGDGPVVTTSSPPATTGQSQSTPASEPSDSASAPAPSDSGSKGK